MLLYLTSGDAYTNVRALVITVTDPDGDPVDLTDTDLTFGVYHPDGDALFTKALGTGITLADQMTDAGKAYIDVEEADTADLSGRYRWELEGADAAGVVTLAGGALYVKSDLMTGGS